VLQWFARRGCGFDIVSGGELDRVLAAGGDPAGSSSPGVGKTRAEMAKALEAGVFCFNVESVGELEALAAVAAASRRTARVSLRVNPDVDARTHPYISTGPARQQVRHRPHRGARGVPSRRRAPGLEVVGIDCHIGSQITESEPYVEALDRLLDLIETLEGEGIPIPHLDVGGGLGIAYDAETPPDAEALVRGSSNASTRAATAGASSSSSRAARSSAMPASSSPRCCTSSRARRRTSASSTRR
jgi:diaminopimelate decarboxylase